MPYKDPAKRRAYNREYQKAYYHRNRDYHRKRVKERKAQIRYKWAQYKSQVACDVCGFKGDPDVIDFHHIDANTKEFAISDMVANGYSWKRIMEEVDKCRPLCANHHRMETAKQQGRRKMY